MDVYNVLYKVSIHGKIVIVDYNMKKLIINEFTL